MGASFRLLTLAAVLSVSAFSTFGLTLEGTFTGATYYVSKTGSNGDAKSWATAKTNIQDAVNLCVDGDTVIVDDGEYSETTNYNISGQGDVPTVVVIKKRIHLVSRNGKAKAHIVGKWSDDGKGAGAGAHRGIYVTSAAANTLIENFTIRDCATAGDSSGVNNHFANGGGVAASATAFLVGCTVDNCRAGQGGALGYNVRPINCIISRCRANGIIQANYRTSYAYNTIFVACGDSTSEHCLLSNVQDELAINCTFVNNTVMAAKPNGDRAANLQNCVFIDSPSETVVRTVPKNCVTTKTASGDRVVSTATENKNKTGASTYQYLSPAAGNWRIVAGAAVIDAGDASFISGASSWLPTEYAAVDFYGNPRTSGTAVDAGAVEAQDVGVTPAAGFITLAEAGTVTANGVSTAVPPDRAGLWLGFTTHPGQVRIVPTLAAGKTFYGYILSGCWDSYATDLSDGFRYPDRNADGGIWFTPPPFGEGVSLTQKLVVNVRRVGPTGDFATIQEAVDASDNWDLVLVAPGRYTATGNQVVSIPKSVSIRSEAGPEQTVIDGEGVRRCVQVESNSSNLQIQGFTLTGGFHAETGAAFYSIPLTTSGGDTVVKGIRPQLTDCIVSNNLAKVAAGATGAWIQRCLFTDNRQTDGTNDRGAAVRNSLVTGSVIRDNPHGNIAAAAYCRIYNTTFAEADTSTLMKNTYRPFDRNTTVINCAVYGGYVDNVNTAITPPAGNVHEAGSGSTEPWVANYADGEAFADGANRDLRLIAGVEATTKGSVSAPDVYRFQSGDINGRAIRYVNGAPMPGALQETVRMLVVLCDSARGTVSPSGMIKVNDGESVDFTATAVNEAHRVIGWVVDGVTNETASATYAYTVDYSKPAFSIEPLFSSDLYVNANVTDDSGDGSTPGTAKKTLAAIAALALSGDTIHAAPGDYDEGSMTATRTIFRNPTSWGYSPSRIVLEKGISLVSEEGPDVTFITGNIGTNANFLGMQAIRGVTAYEKTTVRGFTIRNGATHPVTGNEYDNSNGGGVFAPKAGNAAGTAFIDNCVISGNYARTGGNVWGGILHKCVIRGGHGNSGSTAARYSRLYSCVCSSVKNTSVGYHYGIYSSTIYGTGASNNYELNADDGTSPIENSVLLAECGGLGELNEPSVLKNVRNCIWFDSGVKYGKGEYVGQRQYQLDEATCSDVTVIESREAAGLDADLKPTRDSVAVDKGDTALLAKLPNAETDLAGTPRVLNGGKVDCGAYEYDWRVDYAAALGLRLVVTACDPMVELVEGQVRVPAGEGLEVAGPKWKKDDSVQLTVGDIQGTLNVYAEDGTSPVLTVTAAGTYQLTVANDSPSFRFVVDADGSADLAGFKRLSGMILIVR